MYLSKKEVSDLAAKRQCPRCDLDKTVGNALCRKCRSKLPAHMRLGIENIPSKDGGLVGNALRAAANYFDVHFSSIRRFGGGKKR